MDVRDVSGWYARNRHRYGSNWSEIAEQVKLHAGLACEACEAPHGPSPHVLTVDHLNHDPSDHRWPENLIALCQRCHLARQGLRPRPTTRGEAISRLREWTKRHRDQGRML